jgi:[ribosomal protein S5]-alanine N-acetyltransferase
MSLYPPPEELSTARLRLRKLRLTDAPAIYGNWATDPEVTRFLTWPPHSSQRDTEAFLVTALAGWMNGDEFTWGLIDRATDELIGTIAVVRDGHRLEMGYALARASWGQGLMAEAVIALRDWVAEQPGTFRLWAYCDVDNVGSARVLEKAGFEREGVLRRWARHPNASNEPRDALAYSWIPPIQGR